MNNISATGTTPATATVEPTARRGRGHVLGWVVCVAIGVGLAALPLYAGFATQRLLVEVFVVFAIATAWNLLAGFGGLVAVGQHVFVGVGAYALFVVSNTLGLNPWWTLPLAAAAAAAFALLTAWPMFRLSGAHFAVGTWVLAELVRIAVLNTEALGAGGGLPLETLRDFTRVQRNAGVYWAALAVGGAGSSGCTPSTCWSTSWPAASWSWPSARPRGTRRSRSWGPRGSSRHTPGAGSAPSPPSRRRG